MNFRPKIKIIELFNRSTFDDILNHVEQVRRCFDWPGVTYHDPEYNRWSWHNLPMLCQHQQHPEVIDKVSEIFGQELKPSYCFLAMYGSDGVCPIHTDRPQCQFTIDLLVSGGEDWPIYVASNPYVLRPGEALCYSGTGQRHYRNKMSADSKATFANLVFFHFVPVSWDGPLA